MTAYSIVAEVGKRNHDNTARFRHIYTVECSEPVTPDIATRWLESKNLRVDAIVSITPVTDQPVENIDAFAST